MQGRKYKAKDKILEDFLFQGQEEKDKPLRKQRKVQIQPRCFLSQETRRIFQMGNKGRHSQDAPRGQGKNVEGFSFTPASLAHSQPLKL